MSGDWDEDVCKKAMELVEELCFNSPRGYSQSERCQEFSYLLRGRNRQLDTVVVHWGSDVNRDGSPADRKLLIEISVSLLSVIVTFCGIVLLSVSLFVSWKLCWLPWRDKEGGGLSLTSGLLPGSAGVGGLGGGSLLPPLMQRKEGHSSSSLYPSLASTTPTSLTWWGWREGREEVWWEVRTRPRSRPTWTWTPTPTMPPDRKPDNRARPQKDGDKVTAGLRSEVLWCCCGCCQVVDRDRQEPPVTHRFLFIFSAPSGTLKLSQTSPDVPNSEVGAHPHKDLPNAHSQQQVTARAKPMTHQLSSPDFHEEKEQVTCIGQIKPELYRPKGDQGEGKQGDNCGKISFLLRYAFNTEQLVVKILKALDLPAKDANGFSDPYVKIYLLPDRKKKFQTKVHRKTLNPVFNETFQFGVPLNELHSRKLHFSVYDFDRFSRHDLIGQVVVDNLLDFSEGSGDKPIWRDIVEGTAEKADLGELNFSLCYLPTAGRLTVTIIKATNLKAMDLTGFSDQAGEAGSAPKTPGEQDGKEKNKTPFNCAQVYALFRGHKSSVFPRTRLAPPTLKALMAAVATVIEQCGAFSWGTDNRGDSAPVVSLILLFQDPYVKASLVCDGRRLKKRKTSIKKNTLNPTYNEALVFDIPNENIESVCIVIAVMDYDW
ncbi:Synaptotagmin-C Synaptic vesicle protein O-p65-C [Takifugu flavidus]|uniref:Synaptotagmin-C Synaptic vesicle protein O-p65-C n=1 Tax=Takifugu flavidus TaxID=433684 RepID=A0A5C6NU55_9TELE|nr:Synaptotagmin-C Synaptic vesicle protein O-p65-C [Takifugu flavidus]